MTCSAGRVGDLGLSIMGGEEQMHCTGVKMNTSVSDATECFLSSSSKEGPVLLRADVLACVSAPVLQGPALPLVIPALVISWFPPPSSVLQ